MMRPPEMNKDTANHFAYGAMIASFGAVHSVLMGALLCVFFAIGWEIYQRCWGCGHASVRDALNTIAGAVPVLTPLAIWRITQ